MSAEVRKKKNIVDISEEEKSICIDPEEGKTIFGKILNNEKKRVIVLPVGAEGIEDVLSAYQTQEVKVVEKKERKQFKRPELSTKYEEATNDVEKKLAGIMEELLRIKGIGIDDNFFELGGDSLKGLIFIRLMKQSFNISFAMQNVFEYPTIRQLSKIIQIS